MKSRSGSSRSRMSSALLARYRSGVLISWLMPATSWPSDDIFSACTSCTCDSLRSASVPLELLRASRDALLERFVEHREVGVRAVDLAIAAVQAQRDETDGEQQHDGIDGEHQPRLLDARRRRSCTCPERRCRAPAACVADRRADELLELAFDERLVLSRSCRRRRAARPNVAGHRVDALIAAERHEQALELAAADRRVLAREVERADDELERVGRLAVEIRRRGSPE